MESRWYFAPGQTIENTKISDLEHALHVTKSAWKGLTSHLDRNRIIAETLEKERAHKKALKEGSEAMIKEWPDSIERSHTRKEEERKKRTEEVETVKIQKYMELRKEQDDMKDAYIRKVKQSMFYSKEYPKKLNAALLESEVLYEREKQIEFMKIIKEHQMEEDKKYAAMVKQADEDAIREDKEKEQKVLAKKHELRDIYVKDIKEKKDFIKNQRETRKQRQILDNINATKEIELQQKMAHEDTLAMREKKKRELLDYIKRDNAIKAHIAKEEAEVDEVIKVFDEAKSYIDCMRKMKEQESRHKAIEERAEAAKLAFHAARERDAEFEAMLRKGREENALREEEREMERQEKQKQLRLDRELDRRQYLEHHEKQMQAEKEMQRWQMLNRQKQESVTKEYSEEKKRSDWGKTLEYRQELLDQMEENRIRDAEDKDNDVHTAEFMKTRLEEKDKQFFDYADEVLEHCKSRGRPVEPVLKVVHEYKRQNLLREAPEPFCDPVDIYANRREPMVSTTPGKMLHNPRSDPNYRRCKCHKEDLFK